MSQIERRSWPHFSYDELKCSHCGKIRMDERFMNDIECIRRDFARPMIVTSAYRCPDHPIEAAKDEPGSHTEGVAMDVLVRGLDAYDLLRIAMLFGMKGIGVGQDGDERFLHIDMARGRPSRPRPWVWSY